MLKYLLNIRNEILMELSISDDFEYSKSFFNYKLNDVIIILLLLLL